MSSSSRHSAEIRKEACKEKFHDLVLITNLQSRMGFLRLFFTFQYRQAIPYNSSCGMAFSSIVKKNTDPGKKKEEIRSLTGFSPVSGIGPFPGCPPKSFPFDLFSRKSKVGTDLFIFFTHFSAASFRNIYIYKKKRLKERDLKWMKMNQFLSRFPLFAWKVSLLKKTVSSIRIQAPPA